MNDLKKLNSILKAEASEILHDYGLLNVLSKYGTPVITGSYSLNLMTWRDLDIHLESNGMTEKKFFKLGQEIALSLKPHRMNYRNEFIAKTPDLPTGFYWGTYTTLKFSEVWKIDIWSISSDQMKFYRKKFDDLKCKITENKRPIILRIKEHFCKHPEYRRKFVSTDIYQSVIKESIKSIKEFSEWLEKNKGIS